MIGKFRARYLLLLLLVTIFSKSQGQQLLKGPYIQQVLKNQATICWVTSETTVKYGTSPRSLSQTATEFEVHEMVLDQLRPGQTYYYDIGYGEQGKGQFKTAPKYGAPIRFVVYGDTRFAEKPRPIQAQLIDAIQNDKPAFIINTGDIVTNGLNPVHWDTYFEMNKDIIKSIPYYVSLGNHEKDSPYYYKYFSPAENENYYSFNWSNCHCVVIDSEGPHEEAEHALDYEGRKDAKRKTKEFWDKQLAWLCKDLQNHKEFDFTLVFMHQPLFSLKESRRGEQNEFQERFAQIFEDFGVDIVFSGHDHMYQRHFVKPVHYVVTAGGGAGLYSPGKPFTKYTRKISVNHHYVLIEIEGKKLKAKALKTDGEVIDIFTIPFDNSTDKKRAEKELKLREAANYDTYY